VEAAEVARLFLIMALTVGLRRSTLEALGASPQPEDLGGFAVEEERAKLLVLVSFLQTAGRRRLLEWLKNRAAKTGTAVRSRSAIST
jgi:hypothetical protein